MSTPGEADMKRYIQLRAACKAINTHLTGEIEAATMDEASRRLGMLNDDGSLGVNGNYDLEILMDYAVYDVYKRGLNEVARFERRHAAELSEQEREIVSAMKGARYGLFMCRRAVPSRGLELEPLSGDPFFLTDVSLGNSGWRGMVLAARLIDLGGMTITTGAALPVTDNDTMEDLMLLAAAFSKLSPTKAKAAAFSTAAINRLLDAGASAYMGSKPPELAKPRRLPRRRRATD